MQKTKCTAIPRDTLPLDMLTPQIRHCELRQKNSRYANLVIYLPPAMLFISFFKKIPDMLILVIYLPPAMLFFSVFRKIPDMLILVIYLSPAMLFLISQKIPDMLILVLYLPLTMQL